MNEDNLNMDVETITLTDEEGRSLLCYIGKSIDVEQDEYLLLFPVDAPIQIFVWDQDEEDEDGENSLFDLDDEEIDEVFSTARAVLAEQDLILQRTALILTASGNLPEATEDDLVTFSLDWDDQPSTDEVFHVLRDFYHDEQKYILCTPLDPLPILAKTNGDEQLELLDPEDYERVRSHLEDHLFQDMGLDELDDE